MTDFVGYERLRRILRRSELHPGATENAPGRTIELELEIVQEADYLRRYAQIVKSVDTLYDVRGSDLAALVRCCLDGGGVLSNERRVAFASTVPDPVFDFIEAMAIASGRRPQEKGPESPGP